MWSPNGEIDLAAGSAMRLIGNNDFQLGVEKPSQKAFFAALCEAAPDRIPFGAAIRRARELLIKAGISEPIGEQLLAKGVLRLFTIDQCDLILSSERTWLSVETNVRPSTLVRYQAAQNLPVVNRWHETVDLSEDERRFLAGSDVAVDENALRKTGLIF
jgi:hypothetical protein